MPTAREFSFLKYFPVCIHDDTGGVLDSYPYIGNLTLQEAMAAFWNLYNITVSTSINYSFTNSDLVTQSININGQIRLDPPRAVGMDFLDTGYVNESALFKVSELLPSSVSLEPYKRVCYGSESFTGGYAVVADVHLGMTSVNNNYGVVFVALASDPANNGMYRIHYSFKLSVTSNFSDTGYFGTVSIFCGPSSSYDFSGTASFLGKTIPWKARGDINIVGVTKTATSASLSISTSMYTY